MDATETPPQQGKEVTDRTGTDRERDGDELPTPKESKETVEDVSAYIQADTHVEQPLEVLGSASSGGEPRVSIGMKSAFGLNDAGFSIGLSPETARDLAERLKDRADYAEEYAAAKRGGD